MQWHLEKEVDLFFCALLLLIMLLYGILNTAKEESKRVRFQCLWVFPCLWVFWSLTLFFAGKVATGTVIGTLLGEITHLSFCYSDEQVAACSGTTVYVLSHKVWQRVHLISWDANRAYLILWCDTNYAVFSRTIMSLFPY